MIPTFQKDFACKGWRNKYEDLVTPRTPPVNTFKRDSLTPLYLMLAVVVIILLAHSLSRPAYTGINKEDADKRVVANLKAYIAGVTAGMESRSK